MTYNLSCYKQSTNYRKVTMTKQLQRKVAKASLIEAQLKLLAIAVEAGIDVSTDLKKTREQ